MKAILIILLLALVSSQFVYPVTDPEGVQQDRIMNLYWTDEADTGVSISCTDESGPLSMYGGSIGSDNPTWSFGFDSSNSNASSPPISMGYVQIYDESPSTAGRDVYSFESPLFPDQNNFNYMTARFPTFYRCNFVPDPVIDTNLASTKAMVLLAKENV